MAEELTNAYGEKITLTKEQESCVNYLGERTLMVKGYAGSGKSVVLQKTAKKLLEEYSKNVNNAILLLTYNNTLTKATREVLDKNGDKEHYIQISTLSKKLMDVYNDENSNAPKMRIIKDKDKNGIIEKAFKLHEQQYGHHRFHEVDYSFWKDEFEWMKGMNITSTDLKEYLVLKRRGRGNKVRMREQDRIIAFQLFTFYEKVLSQNGCGDWIDYALYIIRHPECVTDKHKYDYVLIDEAQDLTLAHMMAAVMLMKKRMVIAMDANQHIYDAEWRPKDLGIETTTKKLTKSMRTTIEIDNLAESLRKHNDRLLDEDDKMLRAIPERTGDKPELAHFATREEEKKYVINAVKQSIKDNPNCTIGIIAAENVQLNYYGGWMTDGGIQSETISKKTTFSMTTPGAKICTVHSAKGLEFDVVIIPQFQEGFFPYSFYSDTPEDEELFLIKARNIAYVAMTRAKQVLYITYNTAWKNQGSRFIGEFDKEYYVPVGDIVGYKQTSRNTTPTQNIKPSLPPTSPSNKESKEDYKDLKDYFEKNGFKVIDSRSTGGSLWVVGAKKELDKYVRIAGKLFGAFGYYKDFSKALKEPGWHTNCDK